MNDENKKPTLGFLIDEIAQEAVLGWKEGLAPQKPYAAFGFLSDPFIYTPPEVASLVKTSDLLASIRRIMGHFSDFYSKKTAITDVESYKGHHMLILGASDSGRTYLLEFACVGISDITIPDVGHLNLLFVDAEKDWKFNGNISIQKATKVTENDETSKYQHFTYWLSKHEDTLQEVDILFIDNIASVADIFEYITDQLLQCGAKPLLVASISLAELEWVKYTGLESFLSYFNKLPFYLNPFQDPEFLVELLKNRIKLSGKKESIFTDESIYAIAYLSFGLPGLAIWLASEVLTHIYNMKEKIVTKASVLHVAKHLGFDAANRLLKQFTGPSSQQLILQSTLQVAGEARTKLGRGRNRDYAIIFGGGITNKKLQDTPIIGARSKSTISHHLKALLEDNRFLHVQKKGKSRIYFLERPVLNALELISSKGQFIQESIQFQHQE